MSNTQRFTHLAQDYAAHRPGYPSQAIDWLIRKAHLGNETLVADLGAGTGISTRLIAERGIPVIGIEPNDSMRAEAAAHPWLASSPAPEYRSGTGEATGLPDAAVAAVVVAQAFHWFEPTRALHEADRILKPGGWLFLMGYERDESDAFSRECSELMRSYPGIAEIERQRQTAADVLLSWERLTERVRCQFPGAQVMDEPSFLGRMRSISYLPQAPEVKAELFDKLAALFQSWQRGGKVSMAYVTTITAARKPEADRVTS